MTIDKSIHDKIQKVLELARRGGTEAEANTAMAKALELLAKHNLSMADISDPSEQEEMTTASMSAGRLRWTDNIWMGISQLYFCQYYTGNQYRDGTKRRTHFIVGRESNVDTVKDIATYLVSLGEELARAGSGDLCYRNSFKSGYSHRIYHRATTQMNEAKKQLVDSENQSNLPVANLYLATRRENDAYLASLNIRLTSGRSSRSGISSGDGYRAGQAAGNSVSLASSARGRITR